MLATRVQISAAPLLLLNSPKKILFHQIKKRGEKSMASKKLNRFERARLIGARALQLSMGAKPMVDVTPDMDTIDIAVIELNKKVLPLDVRPM
jgi:DNA-directed RNA polymerase subunit K